MIEDKNNIPKERDALAEYIGNALGMQVSSGLLKSPKKSVTRLLPRYDIVLLVVQSSSIGQTYKCDLDSCESHTVSLVAGKATKVQHQAAALAGVRKLVVIGSPAALLTVVEMGGVDFSGGKVVVGIDGRTNAKGYNIFKLKSEQSQLKTLVERVVELQPNAKCLILNRNAAPLPQPTD